MKKQKKVNTDKLFEFIGSALAIAFIIKIGINEDIKHFFIFIGVLSYVNCLLLIRIYIRK